MNRPTLGPLSKQELVIRLGLLRAGFARVMDLSCSWVATEPETRRKFSLGELIGHTACCVELISQRMRELQAANHSFTIFQPAYLSFTNELMHIGSDENRIFVLVEIILPDLLNAVRALADVVPSQSDSLTEWALQAIVPRIAAWQASWDSLLAEIRSNEGCSTRRHPSPGKSFFEPTEPCVGPEAGIDNGPAVQIPVREHGLLVVEPYCPPPRSLAMFLHGTVFNIEVCAIEVCARIIIEHPAAPWGLKLDMARQIYDEARHAQSLTGRLKELGGHLGDYPIDLRVWRGFRAAQTLPEMLMIQQRIGEGGGLDGGALVVDRARREGDEKTLKLFEYINADEVNHVRNGNRWIRELLCQDDAEIAKLEVRSRNRLVDAQSARKPLPTWIEGRHLAGFSHEEINSAVNAFRAGDQGQSPRACRVTSAPKNNTTTTRKLIL